MTDETAIGTTGLPWTRAEVDLAVASYMDMLRRELRGERYSKAGVVRDLGALLPARSRGSIELKLQNISAVLDEEGWDWIDGYKPRPHYQRDLRTAVVEAMAIGRRIGEALVDYRSSAMVAPQRRSLATDDVRVSPPAPSGMHGRARTSVALTGSPLSALREFQQRALGVAGEEWVCDLERQQLLRAGRPDLASLVRWVARLDGDGAGYDIRSFDGAGAERLIEVKTTNLGPWTPFYITRWEIEVSHRRPDAYALYRVHGFSRDPRLYVLEGDIAQRARLEPKVFLGLPL